MSTVTENAGAAAPDTVGASPEQHDTATQQVELVLGGMTCASCANRIERKLNKLDGVRATVNFATEKARVAVTSDVSTRDLIGAVEAAGYTASVPAPPSAQETTAPRPTGTAEVSRTACGPGCSSPSSSRSP